MIRRIALATLACALLAGPVAAQPAAGDAIDIGPSIGAAAPALTVKDATGTPRSLKSLGARNGTVLVFFRSARWCPFCQRQLIDLKALQAPLAERGYGLAALSYDSPEALAAFAQKQGVAYTLLSDEGSHTIDAYKLRDPQYPEGNFAYGVPKPAIFVLDRRGRVKAKLALEGYKVRPGNDAVLAAIDKPAKG